MNELPIDWFIHNFLRSKKNKRSLRLLIHAYKIHIFENKLKEHIKYKVGI